MPAQDYEYKATRLNAADTAEVRRVLNEEARDGWEVVAMVPLSPPSLSTSAMVSVVMKGTPDVTRAPER